MIRRFLLSLILLTGVGVLPAASQEADPSNEPTDAPVEAPEDRKPQGNPPPIPAEHQERILKDKEIGANVAQQVREQFEFSENQEYIDMIQRIGEKMAVVANENQVEVLWGDDRLSPFHYEFHVIKGDEVNAFAIPSGYIYIYEGLIEFSESEDEVAGVVAHEVSHAAFRHIDKMSREQEQVSMLTLPVFIAAVLAGDSEGIAWAQAAQMANQAFMSDFSVNAEIAADHGAIQYMMKTEYNPVALMTFMERLAIVKEYEPDIDWGIYRTHPPSTQRRNQMVATLKAYGVAIERSAVTTSFRAKVESGDDGRLELWYGDYLIYRFGGDDAIARADRAVQRVNSFMDDVPQPFLVRVNGDRLMGGNLTLLEATQEDAPTGTKADALQEAMASLKTASQNLAFELSKLPSSPEAP